MNFVDRLEMVSARPFVRVTHTQTEMKNQKYKKCKCKTIDTFNDIINVGVLINVLAIVH